MKPKKLLEYAVFVGGVAAICAVSRAVAQRS